jgi:glycine C-acetyltransferase
MYGKIKNIFKTMQTIEDNGIFERIIVGPQDAEITIYGRNCFEFCANNYLGLSSHPEVVQAAKDALDTHMVSECHQCVLFVELKIFTKL